MLRELLDIGELVYVLADRLRKRGNLRRLYKSTTEKIPLFNKDQLLVMRIFSKRGRSRDVYGT